MSPPLFTPTSLFLLVMWTRTCNCSLWLWGTNTRTKAAAAAAKSLQSCPTLCDPIDGSPPGSAVPGILQARTLDWVAISFSNAWKWKVKGESLSRVRLFTTPWTAAHQAPPSMGSSRQEDWSGCQCLLRHSASAGKRWEEPGLQMHPWTITPRPNSPALHSLLLQANKSSPT